MENIITAKKLSVKVQTLAGISALVCAVALPQLFHLLGAWSGTDTSLGEMFLPMHLPIILAGLMCGPYAAGLAGAAAPLMSALLTGMPKAAMLPFICIELFIYGFAAGLLRNVKLPTLVKVLIVQLAGRAVKAAAIAVSVYTLGNTAVSVSVIWTSVTAGLFGIVIQWALIPLIIYRVRGMAEQR